MGRGSNRSDGGKREEMVKKEGRGKAVIRIKRKVKRQRRRGREEKEN